MPCFVHGIGNVAMMSRKGPSTSLYGVAAMKCAPRTLQPRCGHPGSQFRRVAGLAVAHQHDAQVHLLLRLSMTISRGCPGEWDVCCGVEVVPWHVVLAMRCSHRTAFIPVTPAQLPGSLVTIRFGRQQSRISAGHKASQCRNHYSY
jgi:hypothetical protein